MATCRNQHWRAFCDFALQATICFPFLCMCAIFFSFREHTHLPNPPPLGIKNSAGWQLCYHHAVSKITNKFKQYRRKSQPWKFLPRQETSIEKSLHKLKLFKAFKSIKFFIFFLGHFPDCLHTYNNHTTFLLNWKRLRSCQEGKRKHSVNSIFKSPVTFKMGYGHRNWYKAQEVIKQNLKIAF